MSYAADRFGTVEFALKHARRLLHTDPRLAMEQASEILKASPRHPLATLLLGIARRASGDAPAAVEALQTLTASQPRWPAAHYELGLALAEVGQSAGALDALRHAVSLKPDMPDAWRALGDLLLLSGDTVAADQAYARHIKASTKDPRLLVAASALLGGQIAQAELLLRNHLKRAPTDVVAIRMLAEVGARLGRNADAETLLARCLELMPSFTAARHQYAIVLHRQNKAAAALQQLEELLKLDPRNPTYRNLKAAVLVKIGEYRESMDIYADVLRTNPEHPKIWLSYGHTLATSARENDSIAAYRRSIQLSPQMGEAYWSLANLKIFRFLPEEIAAMQKELERGDLPVHDRLHFEFALGKALEDAGQYQASFEHYARGNHLRRSITQYDAVEITALVQRSTNLFSMEFFAARRGYGAPSPEPIFIVGLPRSGSTLIEQILASHSGVEGTMELPDLLMMAAKLGASGKSAGERPYPQVLATLSSSACRELGEEYIAQTQIQRKTARPLFIDKMPNNFLHIGLIQLILPFARIIDARRHPLACCLSAFKMNFAEGYRFSYSLEEIGRYYRDYVAMMSHFDRVLPGRVHRVIHESLVEDTETEVRRLLSYCGLPFEDACLRFYENARPVRTPSAQQVRRPIFRDGLDHWRRYESWLGPLKEALGPVLESYPATPPAFEVQGR